MTLEELAKKIMDLTSYVCRGDRYGHDTCLGSDEQIAAEGAAIIREHFWELDVSDIPVPVVAVGIEPMRLDPVFWVTK